jgi:Zn finger protein HypA/HybF involved in hydrogenase expression
MDSGAHELVVRGEAAARAGDKEEARFFLEWALRLDPPVEEHVRALRWLSEIAQQPDEKRSRLEEALALDPANPLLRRMLALLNGTLRQAEVIDPDHLGPQAPAVAEPQDSHRFVCPKCGGRMTYTPDGSSLVCEYCESRQRLAHPGQAAELDFTVAMAKLEGHRKPIDMPVVTCDGCGAVMLLAPQALSGTCPHCGSHFAIETRRELQLLEPEGLLPFRVDEAAGRRVVEGWLEGKRRPSHLVRMLGQYFPAWTFDLSGEARWKARRYDNQRKTWIPIDGTELVLVNDKAIAGTKVDDERISRLLAELRPEAIMPFDVGYLASWPADTYQISMSDAALEAHSQVFHQTQRRIQGRLSGEIRDLQVDPTGFTIDRFRLILVSLWRAQVVIRDEDQDILISGTTGELLEGRRQGLRGWLATWLKGTSV